VDSQLESLRGHLLIASATLLDPNFHRTVVLVTEHTEEGAMGLVLNRPSSVAVAEALPDLEEFVEEDAAVFRGGPVQPEAAIALAELEDPEAAEEITFAKIGFIRADADPAELAGRVRRARVFAGYAGWGSGQLEAELEEEAWIVEPAAPGDVFSATPGDLWSEVLRRKGGPFALLAQMPLDPSLN
jgi:putative transcriptional regulator